MALVNGGTYYLLSLEDYNTLSTDEDCSTLYQGFLSSFSQITIGNTTCYCASYGSFDPDDLIEAIIADTTGDLGALHAVELETAVYWSGYGFQYQ